MNSEEDVLAGTGVNINDLQQHKQSIMKEDHFTGVAMDSFEPQDVDYILFLKPPEPDDEKLAQKEKVKLMHLENEGELQMRTHITMLLHEAEPLRRLMTTINDPNSLSEIMSVIRQHTEKKKAFGD